jgi:multidrug resistance efflux pump
MRRVRWTWIALGALGLFLLWRIGQTLFGPPPYRPTDADRREAGRQLAHAEDERAPAAPAGAWVAGNGVFEPVGQEHEIAGDRAGRIVAIPVVEGAFVEAGDTLALLAAGPDQAALAAAEADVRAARQELLRRQRGERREDVQGATARAEEAAAQAELSRDVFRRLDAVAGAGGVSEDQLSRARHEASAAEAAAEAADAARRAAVAGSRREDIRAAAARLAAAEARRDEARGALEELTIRAPLAGEVLRINRLVGEYYQPGDEALLVLGDTRRMRVRMEVYERDVGKVRLGARAVVRAVSYPGVDFRGRVGEIGRRMEPKAIGLDDPTQRRDVRVLEVRIDLDDPTGLVPGLRVLCYLEAEAPVQPPLSSRKTGTPRGARTERGASR